MDELLVELVEIGRAHHHEKTYDYQQIAGALLRHTLREELLEHQSGRPRQRNFQIPEVEDLSFIIINPPEPDAVRLEEWGLKAWSTHPGRFRDRTANGFIRWTT